MLFNVLKNACRVEALELGAMVRMERTCPNLDADVFFDQDEVRSAYMLTHTRQTTWPKLNAAMLLIARLGRFLGRKHDGQPRAKTIWLRLREIYVAVKVLRQL